MNCGFTHFEKIRREDTNFFLIYKQVRDAFAKKYIPQSFQSSPSLAMSISEARIPATVTSRFPAMCRPFPDAEGLPRG